ncbi:MAG: sulfatase-like hydrolase/transferase [Synoicihabitans sp.]
MPRILVLLATCCYAFSLGASDRPNIVILLADDLGYADIGVYGGPVKTPHLDKLAKGGTRFESFYSGSAVCSPSRAVLMTGRHHIRTGIYSWIFDETQLSHLRERETTLAEILQREGYATAHVGKWHLGLPTDEIKKPTPDRHGFDYWFATGNNAEPSHRNPINFIRNGERVGEIAGYSSQIVVDEAMAWLDAREDTEKPFLLNIWFHEPHAPIAAPDDIVKIYGDVPEPKDARRSAAVYSGTIDNTDRAIGRLLSKLREVAPVENTLIIYASDNGSYRDDRTGGLRGRKGMNWEGGIRVPGIFYWPGTIPADVLATEPAGLVDVVPTICGFLNLPLPEGVHLDGSDISALLGGGGNEFVRAQPLFWHLQKSRPIVAMRAGDYSLVADPDYDLSTLNMFDEAWIPAIKTGSYTNYQLFNLREDPQQTTDIGPQHPELLAALKTQLLEINASIMADGADWHESPAKPSRN